MTGTIFNASTIYLKLRKSNIQETDVYIVALACVDIFQCIVMCPQYPFMEYYIAEYVKQRPILLHQYMLCGIILTVMYLQLLTIVAMNRAYAVCKPYTYKSSVKRACYVIAGLASISVLNAVILQTAVTFLTYTRLIADAVIIIELAFSFTTLTISYVMIFVKLYTRKRKVERTIYSSNNTYIPDQNRTKSKQSVHVKTIKIFGVITLIFLASFTPSVCIVFNIYGNFNISYFQFFNHNTNFIVYLLFNADFRNDVYNLFKRSRNLIKCCTL